MNMDKDFKILIDNADLLDKDIIQQAVSTHLGHVDISGLEITAELIGRPPYRIGHIIDVIETTMFKTRFQDKITAGSYELNWSNSTLKINHDIIPLSERERDLMIELLNAGDNGCSRDSLLHKIWGYKADLETHALETQIYRLRQKIEISPDKPARLITIDNGYKLV